MQTTAELARLRRRLTILYTFTAAVGLVALAAVTTVVESRLRAERADEELIGWASRAASLVDDSTGGLDPSAIDDDVLDERVDWTAFDADRRGDFVRVGGRDDLEGAMELVATAVGDDDERGTVGSLTIDGDNRRAAAMPLYVDAVARGAVVVAARPQAVDNTLARAVWLATIGLILLGGVVGWWFAGRSIRPAAATLEQHEQFLAAAAHELRTPLARVRAVGEAAELLAKNSTGVEDHDELLGELARLRTLTGEASAVVDQLLLIARVDAGTAVVRPETFDAKSLVEAVRAVHPALRTEVPDGVVLVGDRMLIRLAIENLVGNAERHGAVGGRLPNVSIAVDSLPGGSARVRVSDDGPGIAVEMRAGLFERFGSNDPSGTGVGLWLVRWIAEQHGGTAEVDVSGDHRGARFVIVLPAS
jgi:two-component system, OmpR family, sensor kinase